MPYSVATPAYYAPNRSVSGARRAWSPRSMFRLGEQGVWYDPSDMTTLFQDSAGTIPVTAAGQPVGKLLDKSGRGNHASQATAASRPILVRRPFAGVRNVLIYSGDYSNAVWVKTAATVTLQADGSFLLVDNATNSSHNILQASTTTTVADYYTLSVEVKAAGLNFLRLQMESSTGLVFAGVRFDLSAGTTVATDMATGNGATSISGAVTPLGNGWYRVSATALLPSGSVLRAQIRLVPDAIAFSYVGTGSGVYVRNVQMEQGAAASSYQAVVSSADVTEVGQRDCWALLFDGVDDSLVTANIDFTSTDKLSLYAGVRKSADGAFAIIAELSPSAAGNAGAFNVSGPDNASPNFGFYLNGNATASRRASTFTAPLNAVLSCQYNIGGAIAADEILPRVNGVVPTLTATSSAGTGNFGTYPLYIGRRTAFNQAPFNGLLFGLLITGRLSTAVEQTAAEKQMAASSGVTL